MFQYHLMKKNAGIVLVGSHHDFKSLYELVHEVNEKSLVIRDKEGIFLGLAYDARKAYEGQREVIKPPKHFEEIGIRYGVEILWPVLLVQVKMLRSSLAFMESTKRHQGITYILESVVEDAIHEQFGTLAPAVISAWGRVDPAHPSVEERMDSRGAKFCSMKPADRKKYMPSLLHSFDVMYDMHYKIAVQNGSAQNMLDPAEIDSWAGMEWGDTE